MMHGHEKSRSAVVAVKPMNKAERSAAEQSAAEQSAAETTAAELVEQGAETKGNVDQQRTRRTQRRISVSQMLARIRQHIVAVDTQGGKTRRAKRGGSGLRMGACCRSRSTTRPPNASLEIADDPCGVERIGADGKAVVLGLLVDKFVKFCRGTQTAQQIASLLPYPVCYRPSRDRTHPVPLPSAAIVRRGRGG